MAYVAFPSVLPLPKSPGKEGDWGNIVSPFAARERHPAVVADRPTMSGNTGTIEATSDFLIGGS